MFHKHVVWVDVEGVSSIVFTKKTFSKIATKRGDMLYMENPKDYNFYRKRLCIRPSIKSLIMEDFKILLWGKDFMVCATDITSWVLNFIEYESKME